VRINGNRFQRFLLACVVLGAVVAQSPLAIAAEQKVALVIGNSAYPTSRLRNPVNDAKAMAEKLRTLGFDVALRTDATQRDMTRAISQFGQKLALGSVGLFYYAGHGMQVRGKNYLIPIDAEIETEGSVSSEAVDVDQVLNQLGPARLSMVILDACRNNPFERKFRSAAGGGLAQIDAPTGTMLAYATAPGKVASDGNGSNGLYTEALLKALDMPGLKVEDVFKQVRIQVLKASDSQQTPWESSSMTGEFYFTPDNKAAAADNMLKLAAQERAELTKELEEARRQRDKDAELIKAEMEKLRAELQKIRADAAQAAAPSVVATATTTAKPAPAAPPEKPVTVAITTPPPVVSTTTAAPPPPGKLEPPQQVATIAPSSAASAGEWKERIGLLEKFRGRLTFSKAMAILLDLSNAEELSLLLVHEENMKALPWFSAFALGADKEGNLIWGGAKKQRNMSNALDTALEFCAGSAKNACRIVMVDGEFKEPGVVEVAKQLGAKSPAATREGYLRSLMTPATQAKTGMNSGGAGPTFGFASIR
jgi:uncharacterized caspase-like protein